MANIINAGHPPPRRLRYSAYADDEKVYSES